MICKVLCGVFPPCDDSSNFSYGIVKMSSCLRIKNHEGECIFIGYDRTYFSFKNDWEECPAPFSGGRINDWDIFLWIIDAEAAEYIFTQEKLMN